MSEFGDFKDKAEQYAQQHPEQVEKAEDAVEKKFGIGQQDQEGQGQGQAQGGSGQGSPQGQQGQ